MPSISANSFDSTIDLCFRENRRKRNAKLQVLGY